MQWQFRGECRNPGFREAHGVTERVRRLREESLNTQPRIYMERALLETEAYEQYEGTVSVPELRALTLRHYFSKKKHFYPQGRADCREKGERPQSAPTFPELCCHTVEDMKVMDQRELIRFAVTEEDLRLQQGESSLLGEAFHPAQDSQQHERGMEGRLRMRHFTEFMEQRGPGHTVGSDKIYQKGFADYQEGHPQGHEGPGFSAGSGSAPEKGRAFRHDDCL